MRRFGISGLAAQASGIAFIYIGCAHDFTNKVPTHLRVF